LSLPGIQFKLALELLTSVALWTNPHQIVLSQTVLELRLQDGLAVEGERASQAPCASC
jgi:hypothetical protein